MVGRSVGVSDEECASFARVARLLPIVRRSDGLVLECEGFDRLAEPRFDELWTDRSRTFAAQVSQERIYRSKCLKQADVLMMMMLFPNDFIRDEVAKAWDYYVPYTTHDSSLSAGAHAIIACRLGLHRDAWKFWEQSSLIDLDMTHGGASEGIHIANAGANWQIAVLGFAGMSTAMDTQTLTLRPCLPDAWTSLTFSITWKRTPVEVRIVRNSCTIGNNGDHSIDVRVWESERSVQPGQSVIFELDTMWNR